MSLGVMGSSAGAGTVKIETGSYTGTGTKGSGAPNSLTFSGVPVFVWICRNDSTFMSMFNVANLTSSFKSYGILFQSGNYVGQSSSNQAKIVGKTLSWYYDSDARWQLNESGVTYNWFAITAG